MKYFFFNTYNMKTAEEILLDNMSTNTQEVLDKTPYMKEWILDAMFEYKNQFSVSSIKTEEEYNRLINKYYNT